MLGIDGSEYESATEAAPAADGELHRLLQNVPCMRNAQPISYKRATSARNRPEIAAIPATSWPPYRHLGDVTHYLSYFRKADPLFANSSRTVSSTDAKLGLITGRRTGSVIKWVGGRRFVMAGRAPHRFPLLRK